MKYNQTKPLYCGNTYIPSAIFIFTRSKRHTSYQPSGAAAAVVETALRTFVDSSRLAALLRTGSAAPLAATSCGTALPR